MRAVSGRARRPRARDSQALLQAAARAEFAEFGYAGARVDRIARKAGVNKQLVFYYYGSKLELYTAVISGLMAEIMQPLDIRSRARHAGENLREAFSGMFDTFARRADLARLLLSELRHPGPAQGAYATALKRFTEELRRVVVEGQGHGYFRDDVDPDRAAQQAVILAIGYVVLEGTMDRQLDMTRARTWRDATADLLVRALAW